MTEEKQVQQQPSAVGGEKKQKPDYEALASEVNAKFERWRGDRRPHEVQWFLNAAFVRGLQWVNWNDQRSRLELRDANANKIRLTINRILPKYKARQAKFLKNRFEPMVAPATTDYEDQMNAKATKLALDYIFKKEGAERKYREVLNWANTTGKGFWWFYWDPTAPARVKITDPMGQEKVEDVENAGDVCIDVGSPFELLVEDLGKPYIGQQHEIMRVRAEKVADIEVRFKTRGLKPEGNYSEMFQYQKQIASLNSKGVAGMSASVDGPGSEDEGDSVIVKELFTAPCGKYPKGRHVVVVNDKVMHYADELPFEGWQQRDNPFPVVEFADLEMVGQFWPTTLVEQMMGLQKEYNNLRSRGAENIRAMANPRVMAPVQSKFPKNAFTDDVGAVIYYNPYPNMPNPEILQPVNIAGDVWKAIETNKMEFDEVTNIYPASQGQAGGTTSGFQANLLQEATDSVHGPDIRNHEMSWEAACYKVRKMLAMGYVTERLISVVGKNFLPEVTEFSTNNIDEHAEIRVWSGSMLSSSPAVKTEQVKELFKSGVLGDVADPQTARTARGMLDVYGHESLRQDSLADENMAHLENLEFGKGRPDDYWPMPTENHQVQWDVHTAKLKSNEVRSWPPERLQALIGHTVKHGFYINPQQAITLAANFERPDLVQLVTERLMMQQSALMIAQGGQQPPPPEAPVGGPQGPPPGVAGPPEQPQF